MNKSVFCLCMSAGMWLNHASLAQELIDEVVVSTALKKNQTETSVSIEVLDEDFIRLQGANTIGEAVGNLPGVHSSSFGVGVGQPIIRGLGGNRVSVLQNGVASLDVSGVSQDHASSIEPLLARRIEVLRGPATLLYGNGAIGGVVNVIDNRLPSALSDFNGAAQLKAATANDNTVGTLRLDGSLGQFAWHADGVKRSSDALKIPTSANDPRTGFESTDSRRLVNSETDADEIGIGASWVTDNGFIGVSATKLNNLYGIPSTAGGESDEDEEGEEGPEIIDIDLEQRRLNLKGEYNFSGLISRVGGQLLSTRYTHRELEGAEVGTTFRNRGYEARGFVELKRNGDNRSVIGTQIIRREFSAVGEEAFIPLSEIDSEGLYWVESFAVDKFIIDLGARYDRQEIDTDGACSEDRNSFSASASALWQYTDSINFYTGLTRSERAPTVEETFSNIDNNLCTSLPEDQQTLHAATGRIEIGNVDLDTEVSANLEFGIRLLGDTLQGEFSVYYNQFDDYIFLNDLPTPGLDGEQVSQYLQRDAFFVGGEGKLIWPFYDGGNGKLSAELFGDAVRARFDDGDESDVPRIPPYRLGIGLNYQYQNLSANIKATGVHRQTKRGVSDFVTGSYTRIDALIDYQMPVGNQQLNLFVRGSNLTNEEIRDPTSFLQNFSIASGRSVEVGFSIEF